MTKWFTSKYLLILKTPLETHDEKWEILAYVVKEKSQNCNVEWELHLQQGFSAAAPWTSGAAQLWWGRPVHQTPSSSTPGLSPPDASSTSLLDATIRNVLRHSQVSPERHSRPYLGATGFQNIPSLRCADSLWELPSAHRHPAGKGWNRTRLRLRCVPLLILCQHRPCSVHFVFLQTL